MTNYERLFGNVESAAKVMLEYDAGPSSKIIAVDFDGCLVQNAYPDIGAPNWGVVERLRREQDAGARVILWTCRRDEPLIAAL